MSGFFRYIFCKSYHFCINVFHEDEFPFSWATSIITFMLFANIISLLAFLKYLFYPYGFDNFAEHQKYAAIILLAISNIYMYRKKRYLKHIDYCNQITIKRARAYRVLSIFYYLITIYAFFKSSFLLRSLLDL
jgi:hypothetical protein